MGEKRGNQFELSLEQRIGQFSSVNAQEHSNVVDVRQFKIETHTGRVVEKLRAEGFVQVKDRK